MKYIELPDRYYLRSIFKYNPCSGKLIWKKKIAQRTIVGTEAGWKATKYLQVTVKGKHYYVHRIIWQMVYGNLSTDLQVDHRDRNPLNNRLLNLRKVTQSVNMKNQSLPKNNSSGVIGVNFHKLSGMWLSQITHNKSREWAYHKDKKKAVSWRKQKELEYGFHARHGKPSAMRN